MSSGPATPPGNPRGPPVADPDIIGITADSRQVKAGYLFAALRGTQRDGRAFAAEAAAKGASAILTDDVDALPLDPDTRRRVDIVGDRKSTRLNSSHVSSSYAVFCFKKTRTSTENLIA